MTTVSAQALYAATSQGLYYHDGFEFDDSDAVWERLGQELNIRAAFYDHTDPDALQLGVVGSGTDSTVWLRRTAVGDNWVQILTAQEALTVVGRASNDKEELIWAAHHDGVIYVTFIADVSTQKYLLRTSDYGTNWDFYNLDVTYTVGRVDVLESTGMLYISICDDLGAQGQIMRTPDGASRVEEWDSNDGGGWAPDFFIEQSTGTIIAGLENNTATTPRLVASDIAYSVIDQADVRAGVISPQQTGFTPQGGLWRLGDTIRTLRRDTLYIGEYGGTFISRAISELQPGELGTTRALTGVAGPKLVLGRNANTEDTPDVVFATDDDGVTIWGKGGAHADQIDGGGDSIPYTASVAWGGLCIVEDAVTSIEITVPDIVPACEPVTLTASPERDGFVYEWDADNLVSGQGTASATYMWPEAWRYYIELKVTDSDGNELHAAAIVDVVNNPYCLHYDEDYLNLEAR